jgi:hypothetical protein
MVALDMDAGKIWFGRNGNWLELGNPGSGAQPTFHGITEAVFPAFSSKHGGRGTATVHVHVTSDSWIYKPPTGFRPLTDADEHGVRGDTANEYNETHVRVG